jgi:hypothetical protein
MFGPTSPVNATIEQAVVELRAAASRTVVPWRLPVLAALISVAVGTALAHGLAGGRSAVVPAARSGVSSREGFSSLPFAARAPVSATLGAQNPAYWASPSEGGLQATVAAQGERVVFARSGVEVSSGKVSFGLSVKEAGYGGALRSPGESVPRASLNRVLYAHAGFDEWYATGPLGLEQGFTFDRAPSGAQAGPLTLSLALSGDAHVSLAPGGQGLTLTRGGSSLRYGELSATDARGRALPSWLQLEGRTILLRVDTRGARYPVRIDPLVQQGPKLTPGEGGAGDFFGISVALSGDGNTALIGAPSDAGSGGSAWVFTRSGSTWTEQGEKLTVNEEDVETPGESCVEEINEEVGGCGFGRSVALSADGNTALIGGPREKGSIGGAWVFTRSGSTWTRQGPKLSPDQEIGEGRFGRSVALSPDGNTALIGSPAENDRRGSAWVFTRSGSTWTQQGEKLTGSGEAGEVRFGASVALSSEGDTALIGGPGNAGYHGAAWVFTRSGSTWTQLGAKLVGGEEEGDAGRFGYSVALSSEGNTALIGARSDDADAGAAWVFTRSGSTFTQQGAKLTGAEDGGESEFGYSVALSAEGTAALIGGPRDSSHTGAAWLFTRSGSTWTEQGMKRLGREEVDNAWFGSSVALSGDGTTALVGGPREDQKAGAAWVFLQGAEEEAQEESPHEEESTHKLPVITGLAPASGPDTGGIEVTIGGRNLLDASDPVFGSTPAASYTVNSSTSITAVLPAHSPGLVEVSVTTPKGTSAPTTSDLFEYLSETGSTGTPPVTLTGVSAGTAGTTATGGVLGFGPLASPAACKVALLSRSINVLSHSRAALKITGKGAGHLACTGTVKLTVKTKKTAHRRSRTRTLGTGTFSIALGKIQTVKLKLNAAGRALLAAGHGRLRASLTIVKASPIPVQAQTASVRLVLAKTHKASTHKK